ncbi:MAG: HAD family hydrolase [Clostridia bacterium]|nr:HAD family hydrolase [Clostridia bacterium]
MTWDAILFDLDGTLWDATHITAKIWPGVLANHPEIKRTIDLETVQSYMGRTNEELAEILFPDLPYEKGYALMMEAGEMENLLLSREGGQLFDTLPETLETLAAKYPLGIISNCQSGYIEAFLSHHGFGHLFRDFICTGDTHKEKWENIRILADRQGYKNPVYIGDTLWDACAAEKAGVDFLWAAYGFGEVPEDKRQGILQTPSDIFKYIKR